MIRKKSFGEVDGEEVTLYTFRDVGGLEMKVTNYGGIIQSLEVPDRHGTNEDITLGFENLRKYRTKSPYFGAIVGRYANRISGGTFKVHGDEFNLPLNDEPHGVPCSLHGGEKGFDSRIWEAEEFEEESVHGLRLSRRSEDGEEGYPGNLDVTVTYLLTEDNELQVEYEATTDKATPINLSQHSYFNLKGEGAGKVLEHRLRLLADHYTPVEEGLVPTGDIEPVEGTPLDFTEEHTIGQRIDHDHEQLRLGNGYDHNYVLNHGDGEMGPAARVVEPESGRVMEVRTDQPGVQFYSGNGLNGALVGKSEARYVRHAGLCLETQHFPDSPNHPNFPSTILEPGETFHSKTVFAFSIW